MNLRKTAKGQMCMIRVPGYCNNNPETTVLAHLVGAGVALKQPDMFGAFACSACHDVVDGRVQTEWSHDDVQLMHYQGVIRTQRWWLENGYISLK